MEKEYTAAMNETMVAVKNTVTFTRLDASVCVAETCANSLQERACEESWKTLVCV